MKLVEITKEESTNSYVFVCFQGQVVNNYNEQYLQGLVAPWFKNTDTIFYTKSKNFNNEQIVNFFLTKNGFNG